MTHLHLVNPAQPKQDDVMTTFRSIWYSATPKQREEIALITQDLSIKDPGTCPHKQIIALYHRILPQLRKVKVYTPGRQTHVRARWRDMPSLQEWQAYFELVARCQHLVGKGQPYNGRIWEADFDWLINPQNWAKVIEGKYSG